MVMKRSDRCFGSMMILLLRRRLSLLLLFFLGVVSGRDDRPTGSQSGGPPPAVLNEWLTTFLKVTTELSAESFEPFPQVSFEGITNLLTWTDDENQAVTARFQGRCIVAFRGIVDEIGDLVQALDIRLRVVCRERVLPRFLDEEERRRLQLEDDCCEFRQGWVDSFEATYFVPLIEELEDCRRDCQDKDDCVYITGHSAGAAVTPVAATYFARWNPFVFSYGEPPSVVEPCGALDISRHYRIINTQTGDQGELQYDYVSMTPRLRGTQSIGHLITLSDDVQGLAFVGTNIFTIFQPLCRDCHKMRSKPEISGYRIRMNRIYDLSISSGFTAVRTDGFRDGFACSTSLECRSGRCNNNRCLPALTGTGGPGEIPDLCFPGTSRVAMATGDWKRIDQLVVGDQVLSVKSDTNHLDDRNRQDPKFSVEQVMYLPHTRNQLAATFLEFTCGVEKGELHEHLSDETESPTNMMRTLRATPKHYLYVLDASLDDESVTTSSYTTILAEDIQVGDLLWAAKTTTSAANGGSISAVRTSRHAPCRVQSIDRVTDESSGVYTAFTGSGRLIVDGVVVSSYAQLATPETALGSWFLPRHRSHEWAHNAASILRGAYHLGVADHEWFRYLVDTVYWLGN